VVKSKTDLAIFAGTLLCSPNQFSIEGMTIGTSASWHDASVRSAARFGPEVGVELPSHGRGALTFRNGRETVRPRLAVCTAARDPIQTSLTR
jgi:hypothetical protein